MRQAALLVAVVCLLAAPAVAGATAGPDSAREPGADGVSSLSLAQEDVTRDGVEIGIQLQENGDARWNVSARYELDDPSESAAFARLAEEFKASETGNGFSLDVFRAVAPEVSDRVGREMEIRAQNPRTARTVENGNNSTGVLTLQFTWTNFSRVENETLVVDSFTGTWFGDLQDDQTLTIRPPDGYDTEHFEPEAAIVDGAYQWSGPQAFAPGDPTAVFVESTGPQVQPGLSMTTVLAVGAFALVVGAVVVWAYQRETDVGSGNPTGDPATVNGGATAGDATAGGAASAAASGETSDGASSDAGGEQDVELLSDEERVERLLEENGGRMKQAKIVEETRWSNAKVSQLLSAMDNDGRVEKLRIGRENLISLPGEGVTDE